jgi:hypothetical protein
MAGKKSKQFVIATEGATVDGRTIEGSWIDQMAANYNPEKYRAGINLEHYRGVDPKGLFQNYGFVDALSTGKNADGKKQLLAEISPTDGLVDMVKAKQKVFTSIEVNPKFADTGEAYLMGLAVTDTPASLGTDMLEFTAKNPAGSPLTARKQQPENHFSVGVETVIEFEDVADPGPSIGERIKAIFGRKDRVDAERFTGIEEAIAEVAEHGSTQSAENARQFDKVDGEVRRLTDANTSLIARLTALEEAFNKTPAKTVDRPRADGGASHLTDF